VEIYAVAGGVVALPFQLPDIGIQFEEAHLVCLFLHLLEIIRFFRKIDLQDIMPLQLWEAAAGGLGTDQDILEDPFAVPPMGLSRIDALYQQEGGIEVVDGDAVEGVVLPVEHQDVVNGVASPVPDLVLLEETQGLLLLDLHQANVFRPVKGAGGDEFAEEEEDDAHRQADKNQREAEAVEADAVGLHGDDLVVLRHGAEGHEGRQEDHGGCGLGNDRGDHVEEMGRHLGDRGVVADEHPDLAEEVDDQIDGNNGNHQQQ